MGLTSKDGSVKSTGPTMLLIAVAQHETTQMWLCLVMVRNKQRKTHSVELQCWAHTDNGSTAALAGVIDGLSLRPHEPFIANLDTADFQSTGPYFTIPRSVR